MMHVQVNCCLIDYANVQDCSFVSRLLNIYSHVKTFAAACKRVNEDVDG